MRINRQNHLQLFRGMRIALWTALGALLVASSPAGAIVITKTQIVAAGPNGLSFFVPEPTAPDVPEFFRIDIIDSMWTAPVGVDMLETVGGVVHISDRALFMNTPGGLPPAGLMASILFGSDDDINHLLPPEVEPPPPGLPFLPPWDEALGPLVLDLPMFDPGTGIDRIMRVIIVSDAENPNGGLSDQITLIWVPSPGAIALIGLAGLIGRSRRRG